jgi:hypothetical protein
MSSPTIAPASASPTLRPPPVELGPTEIVGALQASDAVPVASFYFSPDGRWRAELLVIPCTAIGAEQIHAYDELSAVEISTGQRMRIHAQLQNCGGLGEAGLRGEFWSRNSRFFYYTDAREGVPDGCGYWAGSVWRWDSNDGSRTHLGGTVISPDRRWMAAWQEQAIVVWAVDGDELGRAAGAEPAHLPGPIAWSPTSDALVYLQTEGACGPLGMSTVVLVRLPGLEQETLLRSDSPSFSALAWESAPKLTLEDSDGRRWTYDFGSGDVRP